MHENWMPATLIMSLKMKSWIGFDSIECHEAEINSLIR
jgi:hypothetical protein